MLVFPHGHVSLSFCQFFQYWRYFDFLDVHGILVVFKMIKKKTTVHNLFFPTPLHFASAPTHKHSIAPFSYICTVCRKATVPWVHWKGTIYVSLCFLFGIYILGAFVFICDGSPPSFSAYFR